MARQIHARDILIIGDSNIRRNLARSGRHYSQSADIGSARNLAEFAEAVKLIEPEKYRIVIFSMLTNIVIDAGSPLLDPFARIQAISDCLGPLFQDIRYSSFVSSEGVHAVKP
jgi:hypothetical protein